MKTYLYVVLLCLFNKGFAFSAAQFVGKPFDTFDINVGSFTAHFHPEDKYRALFPTLNVSFQGLSAMYFQNTHGDHTGGAGVERYWTTYDWLAGRAYIGYRAGLVYGYCRTSYTFRGLYARCHAKPGRPDSPSVHRKPGFQPIAQLFWTYRQNGLGLYLGTAIAITTVSLVFYFK